MRTIGAPRGSSLSCKGWPQEAALRMLMNNLDPEVAEPPDDLIVYGGSRKAARDWSAFEAICDALRALGHDETLLIQSGTPVAVFQTHPGAPRVLIANALLVPAWETFRDLEDRGLTMYGQMTAGSWIYIGSQGILQRTYETFAAAARRHFGWTLRGRVVVTAGLGGMGGAQPLAAAMNGAASLVVEVDRHRIERRLATRYLDEATADLDEALAAIATWTCEGVAQRQPDEYVARAMQSMARHVEALLMQRGAVRFDDGNNIRAQAARAGVKNAFDIPGFVPEYVRPLFCEGKGPFRWVALSGDPEDIHVTDALALDMFSDDAALVRRIGMARERVAFQGLPARICWLGYGDRTRFGLKINELVRAGVIKAPIVIGRDHLDTGSVARGHGDRGGRFAQGGRKAEARVDPRSGRRRRATRGRGVPRRLPRRTREASHCRCCSESDIAAGKKESVGHGSSTCWV